MRWMVSGVIMTIVWAFLEFLPIGFSYILLIFLAQAIGACIFWPIDNKIFADKRKKVPSIHDRTEWWSSEDINKEIDRILK